jgi:carotenoid cleavage dioxygenase-like enzyme
MWDPDNMYLNGPFAPWREEGEAFDLEVEGELPADLNGALFRVGSNQHFRPQDTARYHWFEGDGMVHAVYLRDGRASYRNRYVGTAGLKVEMREGRAIWEGFLNGRDPARVPEAPPADAPPFKNPANTNVALFHDQLLVFSEVDIPHAMHPGTLETTGRYDFRGGVTGPVTAHFKIDPVSGDMLFFGAMGTTMTWYRGDREGKVLDMYGFDMGVPSFIHDYVVTDDYAVFLINPALTRFENVMQGKPAAVWEPDVLEVSRFAVLERATGQVRWIDAANAFTQTHFLNAYQSGSKIIVDGNRTDRFGVPKEHVDTPPPGGDWNTWFSTMLATPWRWELDLATGRLGESQITDVPSEFPRINDSHAGLAHRFGYTATTRGAGDWLTDGLAKQDYQLGRTELQLLDGSLTSPSEPVFVPREGGVREDDGWLLSIWWDPATDRSEVIVQAAQDFTAAPVARIKLNHRVPLGFHGNWASAADLDAAIKQS